MCILESIAYGSAIHILRQDATVRSIVVIGYKFTLIPIVSMLQLILSFSFFSLNMLQNY